MIGICGRWFYVVDRLVTASSLISFLFYWNIPNLKNMLVDGTKRPHITTIRTHIRYLIVNDDNANNVQFHFIMFCVCYFYSARCLFNRPETSLCCLIFSTLNSVWSDRLSLIIKPEKKANTHITLNVSAHFHWSVCSSEKLNYNQHKSVCSNPLGQHKFRITNASYFSFSLNLLAKFSNIPQNTHTQRNVAVNNENLWCNACISTLDPDFSLHREYVEEKKKKGINSSAILCVQLNINLTMALKRFIRKQKSTRITQWK